MSRSISIGKSKSIEQKARSLARQFASDFLVQSAMEIDLENLSGPYQDPAPIMQLCPRAPDSMDSILVEACFDETLDRVGLNLYSLCDLGLETYITAFIRGWVIGCMERAGKDPLSEGLGGDPTSTEFALSLTVEV